MSKTNHIQMGDEIYCHLLRNVEVMNKSFFYENCKTCPYFNGTAQGDGQECLFDDGSNEPFINIWNPYQWWRKNFEQLRPVGITE